MHKNELICQKCAINCGIEGNASNENITKYKNLSGVKSISNSVQWLARYRIVALISIGRLCIILRDFFWLKGPVVVLESCTGVGTRMAQL